MGQSGWLVFHEPLVLAELGESFFIIKPRQFLYDRRWYSGAPILKIPGLQIQLDPAVQGGNMGLPPPMITGV
jgi:hypothetical protein